MLDGGDAPIRVLIVDDSAMIRRVVQRAIQRDGRLSVAGVAPSGESALAQIRDVRPDVVLLDIAMPNLNGLEVLDEIRERHRGLPVVVFSAKVQRGAKSRQEAIARGASTVVAKPDGSAEDVGKTIQSLMDKLVSVASTRAQLDALRRGQRDQVAATPRPTHRRALGLPPAVAVVGASTGGPNALAELIDGLPEDIGVPMAVVQHMPPVLTRYLAKRLDIRTPYRVFEVSHGDLLRPGCIGIAPGDQHLELTRSPEGLRASLNRGPPENSCRPAVDVLFRSAVHVCGSRVLGVVLTGMGQDGLAGSRQVKEAGGHILVQSGETCVVWGMPRVVEEAGLADQVIAIQHLGQRLGAALKGGVT